MMAHVFKGSSRLLPAVLSSVVGEGGEARVRMGAPAGNC